MPRHTSQKFRSVALAELTRQLLFAPPERRRAQVWRAERLHDQLEPEASYPLEFVIYRITGYRSEYQQEELLSGAAIAPDLRLLIDKLSASISSPPELTSELALESPPKPTALRRGLPSPPESPPPPESSPEVDSAAPLEMSGEVSVEPSAVLDRVSPGGTPANLVAAEITETAEELAGRLGIATRTLVRWRKLGLRWRWEADGGGRARVVYPRRAVEVFLARHPELVQRATGFSQLAAEERQRLLARARRLAQGRDLTLNQVAAHLARRTGRALETLRQILRKHEAAHPEARIFMDLTGPLQPAQKQEIARALAAGESVAELCRRYHKTRSTLRRWVQEVRAQALRKRKICFVMLPTFTRADAEEVYLRALPAPADRPDAPFVPPAVATGDLPAALEPLFRGPMLAPERAHQLLLRMNYLNYKAFQLREKLDRYEPRATQLDVMEACLQEAQAIRGELFQAYLPVVLMVARKQLAGRHGSDTHLLLELLEEGHMALREALASFDCATARSFEAYLTWTLMRQFARHADSLPGVDADVRGTGPRAHRRDETERLVQRLLRLGAGDSQAADG